MEKQELNNVEVPPSRKARGLGGGVQIRLTTVRSKDGWRAVAVLPNQMGQNHVALSLTHTHTHKTESSQPNLTTCMFFFLIFFFSYLLSPIGFSPALSPVLMDSHF